MHFPVFSNEIICKNSNTDYINLCSIKDSKNNFVCKPTPIPICFKDYDDYLKNIKNKNTDVYYIDRGTMLFIYFENNNMCISTKSKKNCNNNIWYQNKTFEKIIINELRKYNINIKTINTDCPNSTHTFTLTEKGMLIYIKSVNNKTLDIYESDILSKNITRPKVADKTILKDEILDTYEHLGYIIRNNDTKTWYIVKSSLYYLVDRYFGKINNQYERTCVLNQYSDDEKLYNILSKYI